MKILLVEDDIELASTLADELRAFYLVDLCRSGECCLALVEAHFYNIIILDLGLPDMSGIDVCKLLRLRKIFTPILVLTGRSQSSDRLLAFDAEADDYVVKPFDIEELIARVRALARRSQAPISSSVLFSGSLFLNPISREVVFNQKRIMLCRKEFDLLEFLLLSQPNIVTREEILDHVWDKNVDAFTNVIDVHINHLRNKIDRPFAIKLIETVYGYGYRINPSN